MKIKVITNEKIIFDTGDYIRFDHKQDCCENNWADFSQLEDTVAMDFEFNMDELLFESTDGEGFRFGNDGNMFFVPCYSDQNGYYSSMIDIYFNEDIVLYFECKERLD